jgi:methylamine dehydrogenase accessory protein MauD
VEGWWAASYVLLWLLVIALCAVVVALARQIGTLHLRLGPRGALEMDTEGPPLGELPPPALATEPNGDEVDLAAPGQRRVVLFVSPGCGTCAQVLPGLDAVASAGGHAAYAVSELDFDETRISFGGRDARERVLSGPEVARAWGIPGTPFAVVLDENAVVRAKGTPNNLEQLEGLVDSARDRADAGNPAGLAEEANR